MSWKRNQTRYSKRKPKKFNKNKFKKFIKQYRNNPIKSTEDFYGVKLYWYQKILLKYLMNGEIGNEKTRS
ncbi:hypothetical protein [Clostridium sp.]|uniref:hypothetical protein n=1 Tax=Clostridium sp. TaxID=1506 RepID=UPI0026372193|nr:hypothetical protein [Clostridium sp.]